MPDIPAITIFVVTLAAAIYCLEYIRELTEKAIQAIIRRHLQSIEELHDHAYEEVETAFAFWWSDKPAQTVRQALRGQQPLIAQAEDVPAELLDVLFAPLVDTYRSLALHLAVHARMSQEERRILKRLTNFYGIREYALKKRSEHEEQLEAERARLVAVGIDVDQLEADFASSGK